MRERTRFIEDQTGRGKLEVTLPGGRYQLSLDDAAISLLRNDLGLTLGEIVPEAIVPILIATRDAWFPRQQDTEAVVADLPTGGELTDRERAALITYLETTRINPRDKSLVIEVLAESPVADTIDETDLNIASLPKIPDNIDMTGGVSTPVSTSTGTPPGHGEKQPGPSGPVPPQTEYEIQDIPGIGSHRAAVLQECGFSTVSQIAESRPADIADISELPEKLATVAVEGARELIEQETPTEERLASRTGVDSDWFEAALASLAASGVPPSEAAPVLEVLHGPTVVDIGSVDGQQAYYLWSAGYRTPADVAHATIDELCEVPYIGQNTAPRIIKAAKSML